MTTSTRIKSQASHLIKKISMPGARIGEALNDIEAGGAVEANTLRVVARAMRVLAQDDMGLYLARNLYLEACRRYPETFGLLMARAEVELQANNPTGAKEYIQRASHFLPNESSEAIGTFAQLCLAYDLPEPAAAALTLQCNEKLTMPRALARAAALAQTQKWEEAATTTAWPVRFKEAFLPKNKSIVLGGLKLQKFIAQHGFGKAEFDKDLEFARSKNLIGDAAFTKLTTEEVVLPASLPEILHMLDVPLNTQQSLHR